MMRGATLLWAVLAALAGTGLFLLKYEVQAEEERLSGLRKDIVETQEAIHVLKAEWSYLNDPQRLSLQAQRHLGMKPMRAEQFATVAVLPMAVPHASQPQHAPDAAPPPPTPREENTAPGRPGPAQVAALPAPARTAQPKPAAPAETRAPQPAEKPKAARPSAGHAPVPAPARAEPAYRPAPVTVSQPSSRPAYAPPARVEPAPAGVYQPPQPRPAYVPPALPRPVEAAAAGGDGRNIMVITSPALMAGNGGRP